MKLQDNNDCFKANGKQRKEKRARGILLFASLSLFCIFSCFSQEEEKIPLTYESIMAGTGNTSIYDTYLSPLEYKGKNIGIIYEQTGMAGLLNGRISSQHLFNMEIAGTKNPSGTANNYAGNLEYCYGLYYRFKPIHKIQFFAGMQADGLVGFVYNNRNGNNPVSGKFNLNLNVSGMTSYKFRLKKQPLLLRYQLNIPVAGCLLSPQFGQSYYEIGLGNHHGLAHFASFHNQLIISNLFSLELPFNSFILRLAYTNRIYETRLNSLDTRNVSNSFYVGFSKNFYVVHGKENKNNYRYVFE